MADARNPGPLDRIAAALERIAHSLDVVVSQQRAKRTAKVKRSKPQHRPPRMVEVDDVSRRRAEQALRRAGVLS